MSAELQLDNRCHHTSADGRRCRMLGGQGDPSLCPEHRRQQFPPHVAPEAVAAELLGSVEDFQSATAVNQVLGRLFALVANQRIPPRHAVVLAYIGQLLLSSIPAVDHEMTATEGRFDWRDTLRHALRKLRDRKSPGLAKMVLKPAAHARHDKEPRHELR